MPPCAACICPTNPQVCACTLSRRFPISFDVQRHGSAQFQSMPMYPGRCASLRANRCFCHRTVIHGTPGSARGYPDRPHTKGARLCYTLHLPCLPPISRICRMRSAVWRMREPITCIWTSWTDTLCRISASGRGLSGRSGGTPDCFLTCT